jgi:hypothetical protein
MIVEELADRLGVNLDSVQTALRNIRSELLRLRPALIAVSEGVEKFETSRRREVVLREVRGGREED